MRTAESLKPFYDYYLLKLRQTLGDSVEWRVDPKMSVWERHDGFVVYLDVTVKAKEGDEKATHGPWPDGQIIQSKACSFFLPAFVFASETLGGLADFMQKKIAEGVKNLRAIGLVDDPVQPVEADWRAWPVTSDAPAEKPKKINFREFL